MLHWSITLHINDWITFMFNCYGIQRCGYLWDFRSWQPFFLFPLSRWRHYHQLSNGDVCLLWSHILHYWIRTKISRNWKVLEFKLSPLTLFLFFWCSHHLLELLETCIKMSSVFDWSFSLSHDINHIFKNFEVLFQTHQNLFLPFIHWFN